MKITFSTREYEFSHGKLPRGRGGWGFFFSRDDTSDCMKCWFPPGSHTYAEARSLARDEAKRRGATVVYVAP